MSSFRRKFVRWPPSLKEVSAYQLRTLTEAEFQQLLRLVRKRERALGTSRRANEVARKFILKRRIDKRNPYRSQMILAEFKDCEFCDSLIKDRKRRWRAISNRKRGVEVDCRGFSFIDNPLGAISALRSIAAAECDSINFRINFNDRYVQDIGPYLVFGMMREKMAPVTTGGRVSGSVIKVLESVRLREFLQMEPFGPIDMDDVWALPLKHRRKSGSTTSGHFAYQPTTVEITADQIVEQVNGWLAEVAQELTDYGASKIKGVIGEILNNAERHSRIGGDGEWITAGFMAKRPVPDAPERHAHVCHLCLFSPGRSISDTIGDAPEEVVSQMQRYVALHEKRTLSGETLSAVFALQDGISRVDQSDGNPTGGTGLMDIAEFVNEVGRTALPEMDAKVAILSGSSYIRFAPPYGRGESNGQENRRLQWFNRENNIRMPPEGTHVMDLPWKFPGTLITMRFALDDSLADGD